MKLSKNEFKKIAKTARRITGTEKEYTYNGDPYFVEAEVSYEKMLQELARCSRWSASQFDTTIFACGSIANFTVYL